jgi:hypothetical protein
MAKTKISEFDIDPSNNTDINSINIAEGCAPSGINNAIRQLMSDLKEFQTGASGDDFTVAGALDITGTLELDGSTGSAGQVLVSGGSGTTPSWGNAFVAGMIMLWSGAANAIPSGWLLCNGSNNTPDLRNRFVVGAGSTYAVGATGGSADAIVVSHTHTATSTVTDAGHQHQWGANEFAKNKINSGQTSSDGVNGLGGDALTNSATTGITVATTIASTGSSGTNANLPPYYALCYIMKA